MVSDIYLLSFAVSLPEFSIIELHENIQRRVFVKVEEVKCRFLVSNYERETIRNVGDHQIFFKKSQKVLVLFRNWRFSDNTLA